MSSGPRANNQTSHFNMLKDEKSPYLLQHATNPVNWYPWSDEAFEKARKEDKPIFLSIGYSTCHWCHVMEHESFEDEKVAQLMNETFISIKVDREERPDVDNIYMMVCQMITGSGGWPLTIIMTPDKKPFFAGTYIPRDNRFGHIGMKQLVPRIKDIWEKRRAEVLESAEKITEALAEASSSSVSSNGLGKWSLKSAYEYFAQNFDPRFGGFGRVPKFPTPHNFQFLLRYWMRTDENMAIMMVGKTLQAMYQGGIYDHIGFGFHRYSTDPQWLVPHFEKMLYDQALLAMAYIEAYQATGNNEYKRAAQEIFEFVLCDLTDNNSGFHSAIDADSEGVEGKYYLWREDEIRAILSTDEVDLFIKIYNIKKEGNFEEPGVGHPGGANILHLEKSIEEHAAELGLPENFLRERLENSRQKLYAYRKNREHPLKDDKILSDWNGLMIAALGLGAQVFDEPQYAIAAGKALDFILAKMTNQTGHLLHRYRDGEAAGQANINDYAFLIWGLIELYEATFNVTYIKSALKMNETMIQRFWDDNSGGFYFVPNDTNDLIVRQKETYDGALPSANSIAALNLLRLARMTGNADFEKKARRTIDISVDQVSRSPQAFTQLLVALDYSLGPNFEIVIVGDAQANDTQEMLRALRAHFIPNKVVIFKPTDDGADAIEPFANFIKEHKCVEGRATAYICWNHTCYHPTTDIAKMLEMLGINAKSS